MLEGIEILSQSEIMQRSLWAKFAFSFFIGFTFIGLILMVVFAVVYNENYVTVSAGFLIFGFVCALILCAIDPEEPSGRYEYKVLINEDVSFTDLYEKYDVVGQEGLIWTLKDKEPKDD